MSKLLIEIKYQLAKIVVAARKFTVNLWAVLITHSVSTEITAAFQGQSLERFREYCIGKSIQQLFRAKRRDQ